MGFTYTPDTLTAKESGLDLLAVSALAYPCHRSTDLSR